MLIHFPLDCLPFDLPVVAGLELVFDQLRDYIHRQVSLHLAIHCFQYFSVIQQQDFAGSNLPENRLDDLLLIFDPLLVHTFEGFSLPGEIERFLAAAVVPSLHIRPVCNRRLEGVV